MPRKLKLKCPSCGRPLCSDEFAKHYAWCVNEACPLFIRRMSQFDLLIVSQGSFMTDEFLEKG